MLAGHGASIVVLAVSLANIVDQRTGSHLYDLLNEIITEHAPPEFQAFLSDILQHALLDTSTNAATAAAIVVWGKPKAIRGLLLPGERSSIPPPIGGPIRTSVL